MIWHNKDTGYTNTHGCSPASPRVVHAVPRSEVLGLSSSTPSKTTARAGPPFKPAVPLAAVISTKPCTVPLAALQTE
eukprot:scaffold92797_cov39-Prasinocladus_malaysianus.AAC.1